MAQLIEDMSRDEQIAEIHNILRAATDGFAEMSSHPMIRALRFPTITTEQFSTDPVADSLALLRQLGAVMEAVGNNPALGTMAKMVVGS